MKKGLICLILLTLTNIYLINSIGINNPKLPSIEKTSTIISSVNYSLVNVNNSLYLNSKQDTYFYPYSNPYNFLNTSTGDNSTWNESRANSLYYIKNLVDNNFSLYLLLTDQRFNDTQLIKENNDTWTNRCVNTSYLTTYSNITYENKADYQFLNNNFNGSGNIGTTGNINVSGIETYQIRFHNGSALDLSACVIEKDGTGTGVKFSGTNCYLYISGVTSKFYSDGISYFRGNITKDQNNRMVSFSTPIQIFGNMTYNDCNMSNKGAIYYDNNLNKHYGCNSSNWNSIYDTDTTGVGGGSYNASYEDYIVTNKSNLSKSFDGYNLQNFNTTFINWIWNTIISNNLTWTYQSFNSTYAGFVQDNSTWSESRANNLYQNFTTTYSNQCSGTDKISNVTIRNGILITVCTTDQTSAGGGDGTGGWTNTSINTTTNYDVLTNASIYGNGLRIEHPRGQSPSVEVYSYEMEYPVASYNRITTAPVANFLERGVSTCLNFSNAGSIGGDGGFIMFGATSTNTKIFEIVKLDYFGIRARRTNGNGRKDIIGIFQSVTTVDQHTNITGVLFYSNVTNKSTEIGNWIGMVCINQRPGKDCPNVTSSVSNDTNWHIFEIEGNNRKPIGNNTNWTFYIDGVKLGSVTITNQTAFASSGGTWTESSDGTNDPLNIDWAYAELQRSVI